MASQQEPHQDLIPVAVAVPPAPHSPYDEAVNAIKSKDTNAFKMIVANNRQELGADSILTLFFNVVRTLDVNTMIWMMHPSLNFGCTPVVEHPLKKYAPLHQAAACGDVDKILCLLANGANVEHKDQHGATPLLWAIQGDCFDAVKLLIGRGARVDAVDIQGHGLLHVAARAGHFRIAEWLIEELKFDTTTKDNFGFDPVTAAYNKILKLDPLSAEVARIQTCIAFINDSPRHSFAPYLHLLGSLSPDALDA